MGTEMKNREVKAKQNTLGGVSFMLLLSSERPSRNHPVIPNLCYVPFRNQNLRKIFGYVLSPDKPAKH